MDTIRRRNMLLSGGGANQQVFTGTITPESDAEKVTVSVPTKCSFFLIAINTLWSEFTPTSAGRQLIMGKGTSEYTTVVDCSYDRSGKYFRDAQPNWRNGITFSDNQITAMFEGNGGIARFPAGQEYRWFAIV